MVHVNSKNNIVRTDKTISAYMMISSSVSIVSSSNRIPNLLGRGFRFGFVQSDALRCT